MIIVDTKKYMKSILIYINEVHFCKKLYDDNTLLDRPKKNCAPNVLNVSCNNMDKQAIKSDN